MSGRSAGIAEGAAGFDLERISAAIEEQAEVRELSAGMARRVADPLSGREPPMERSAPQHRRLVLLGHRDPAVELQRLLHGWIVE
jgi:hypothetical protein